MPSVNPGWPRWKPCLHRTVRGTSPSWYLRWPASSPVPVAWNPVCLTHFRGVDHSPHPNGLGYDPTARTTHVSIHAPWAWHGNTRQCSSRGTGQGTTTHTPHTCPGHHIRSHGAKGHYGNCFHSQTVGRASAVTGT